MTGFNHVETNEGGHIGSGEHCMEFHKRVAQLKSICSACDNMKIQNQQHKMRSKQM